MPIIPNKRSMLASGLESTGLVRLLERTAARSGAVMALAYHRIGNPGSDPFYSPLISATPEAFRAELEAIARVYRILSLDDMITLVDHHTLPDKPSVLITFDDGYRDNLDIAAPILTRLGLPAVLFATTAYIDQSIVPWCDQVAHILKSTRRDSITLEHPGPLTLDLQGTPDAAIATLIGQFIARGWNADDAEIAHLAERAEVSLDRPALARRLFLTWDELPALQAAGFAIAAHSHSHRRLAGLNESEQRTELEAPRRTLEARLGKPVVALAYPFGGADSFDTLTCRLTREAGYRLAFALRPGVIRPEATATDPLNLPRFAISGADSPTLLRARLALAAGIGRAVL